MSNFSAAGAPPWSPAAFFCRDETQDQIVQRTFVYGGLLVILIVVGLLVIESISLSPSHLKSSIAKNAAVSLQVGNQQFISEYGHPPALGNNGSDTLIEADNHRLMNILRGRDTTQNPRKIPFITYKEARDPKNPQDGYDSAGNLLDPWGSPYVILLDTDQDGQVTVHGEVIKAGAAIWSYGPNGKPDLPNEGDDIMSWK